MLKKILDSSNSFSFKILKSSSKLLVRYGDESIRCKFKNKLKRTILIIREIIFVLVSL